MFKRSGRILMTLVIPLTLVAVAVLMLLLFSLKSSKRVRTLTYETLQSIGTQQRDMLDAKLSGEFSVLEVITGVVESADERYTEQMLEHIAAAVQNSDFVDMYIIGKDGYGFTVDNETVYFGDCKYFKTAMAGDQTISRANQNKTGRDDECFILMVPIQSQDGISGVVAGILTTDAISQLLRIEYYEDGESFISDSTGNIIVGSESLSTLLHNEDLFTVFANAQFDDSFSATSTVKDIHAQQEGFVSYSIDGEHWYLSYLPIEINDWSICTAIPGEVVDAALSAEMLNGYMIIGVAMTCAALLILFVIALYAGASKRAREEKERLLIAREEYRISARQSGAMILRYDLRSRRLMPNEIMMERYNLSKEAWRDGNTAVLDGMIAAESKAEYKAFWLAIQNGEPNGRIECRMENSESGFGWYSFEFTAIFDEKGNSVQAIITLRDVTRLHERAASYERWHNMMSVLIGTSMAYMEANLTTRGCELAEGVFQKWKDGYERADAETVLLAFEQNVIDPDDRLEFRTFVNPERLRLLFLSGAAKDTREMRMIKDDGSKGLCEISVQMKGYPNSGDVKAVIAVTDLGDGASNMERLSDLAFRDDLSGLLNRTAARAAIEETLRFGENEIIALFMLDIDNFKQVNDTLGHQMGDEALIRISDTIKNMFRATDVVARIGGDEFFVFLPDATSLGIVQTKAEALCDALNFTFSNGIQSASISASIGVVVSKRDQTDYDTLYSEADYALYEAKNAGKNRYCIRRQDAPGDSAYIRMSGSAYSVQLYTLLKHMDGGISILEIDDTIRLLYSAGSDPNTISGESFCEDDIHPDDRQYVVSSLKQRAIDGTMIEIAYRNRQKDGDSGWRHMRAIRIPYSGSSLPVLAAAITDITDMKRSVAQLEPVISSAATGILILRFGERIEATFFNDAFLRILNMNYDQFKLVSRDCASLFRPADALKLREDVRAASAGNHPLKFSFLTMNQKNPNLHRVLARGIKIDEQNGVPAYLLILSDEGETGRESTSDIRLF